MRRAQAVKQKQLNKIKIAEKYLEESLNGCKFARLRQLDEVFGSDIDPECPNSAMNVMQDLKENILEKHLVNIITDENASTGNLRGLCMISKQFMQGPDHSDATLAEILPQLNSGFHEKAGYLYKQMDVDYEKVINMLELEGKALLGLFQDPDSSISNESNTSFLSLQQLEAARMELFSYVKSQLFY